MGKFETNGFEFKTVDQLKINTKNHPGKFFPFCSNDLNKLLVLNFPSFEEYNNEEFSLKTIE